MSAPAVEVRLPTHTVPSHEQSVVGVTSPLTPDLEEFRGIPFGFVPGRWKHSEIRLSLPSDRYDASHNGPKCPQLAEFNTSQAYQSHLDFPDDVTESEFECLNLLIIRPSEAALKKIGKSAEKLPVFLWIHGGGLGFGAATDPMSDPSRLVLESISLGTPLIAVNINYRLNVFGFAASTELLQSQTVDQIRGCNFGLRDQHIGILWTSRNISSFGGDPEKITIGGQSAGAASVHLHTLSAKLKPREQPLFRRSIMQSGSLGTLGPSPLDEANQKWDTLCKVFGLEADDSISRLQKLLTLSPEELVRAQRKLGWWASNVIIDNETVRSTDIGCDVLVNFDEKRDLNVNGGAPSGDPIEVLIGDTETEGTLFAPGVLKILSFEDVEPIFRESYPSSSAANDILEVYGINHETPIAQLRLQLFRFIGDMMFGQPLSRAREIFSSSQTTWTDSPASGVNPHLYLPTRIHPYKVKFGNPFSGPSQNISHHCVELIYLFDAFHDDLVNTDRIEAGTGDQLSASFTRSSTTVTLDTKSVDPPARNPKMKTNIALSKDMQKDWIDFVTKDRIQETDLGCSSEDTITIYDIDREVRQDSLSDGKEWAKQAKRFEVLIRHPEAARQVWRNFA